VRWDGDFRLTASPGYNYYPGRYRIGAVWGDHDTLTVHDDPQEILVTDQVMRCNKDRAAEGVVTIDGLFFNPHVTRHCSLPALVGEANQIVAGGSAVTFTMEEASDTFKAYGDGTPFALAERRLNGAGKKHYYFAQPE
jgi:hypothetical protein